MPRNVPLPWPQVTAAKLAAGAVSYSSLADGTVALIANEVTDTRTIVGAVTLSGLKPIARGSGFSVPQAKAPGAILKPRPLSASRLRASAGP